MSSLLQVQDMEEESSEEEDESPAAPVPSGKKGPPVPMPGREVLQPPPLPPTPDKVLVKKGYDPKQGELLLVL
jgi:splicing factor 3A subunit 1